MKNSNLKAYLISFLALAVVIMISYWVIMRVKNYHIATIKSDQEIVVDKILYAMKFKIEGTIAALKLTERFFQSSNTISRNEFKNYAEGVLELHPEVQTLAWLPIVSLKERADFELSIQKEGFSGFKITQKDAANNFVSAGEREFYTPVYYVESLSGNELAFGLDSHSNVQEKDAIDFAIQANSTSISSPINFAQENQNQTSVLMYQPHSRNGKIKGLVLFIVRVDNFVDSLNSYNTFDHEFEYRLSDAEAKNSLLTQSVGEFSKAEQWFLIKQHFNIANRIWNIEANFDIDIDAGYQLGKFWSWFFGLMSIIFALLVSFLIYSRIRFTEAAKKSAEAFSSEEERYQKLLNSSADAYFLQDLKGNLLDVNLVACTAMGYSREELLQMNVLDVNVMIEGSSKQDYLDYFENFPKGRTIHRELLYKKKDGTFFPVELSMNKFTYRNEDVLSGFIRDISDRKDYENSLKKATRAAEDANSAKSEFLAKMSHEFRTPMHSILSFSDMGIKRLNKVPLEKLESYFNNIQISGNRLMRLLNNLLDLAKLETGKLKYCFEKRSLSLILDDCISEQALQLREKNIQLDIKKQELSDNVVCDIDKIRQVITNLVSNAVKFTPQNSSIHISIERDDDSLNTKGIRFCICDEGEGIPEDEFADVFDKFVQSSKVTADQGGTGLGLAICSEIIEGHSGKIWAENVSCGASLKFVIPLTPNEG